MALCDELRLAATFHSGGQGWGSRASTTNYLYNHIGSFAAGQEAAARSLFFGGVPVRHPSLRFSFLEGGVAWGASLFADILGHWHKRNAQAVLHYDPDALDRPGRAGTVGDVDVLDHGTVTVDATRPALLVISHGWQQGWSATVDGNDAPLVRADGLVLGVPVPAGHHEVKVTFTPPGLRLGAAITVASAVVCFGVVPAVITFRRRRRRTAEPAAGAPCP